jgi:hypothetical protein
MFDTGVRQFRMAMGMVWGRQLNPASLARSDLHETTFVGQPALVGA